MEYFPFCCQQLLDVYYTHMIIKYLYVWPFVQQTEGKIYQCVFGVIMSLHA